MVLVSDDEDGEGAVLTMTDPPDFIGPTHDDRETYTHKVELGGTVAITRVEDDSGQSVNISDISLPVPPRQILRAGETTPQPAEVPVAIYILGDVTPDIATVSAKLTAQMQNTRERFAQIGLKVSFIGPITMPMPLQLPSPNGLSHSNLIQQPDGYTQEEKAIINTAAGASGTPLSDGTIAVYVCKSLLHFSQVEVPLNERDILYGYTWQGKAPVGIITLTISSSMESSSTTCDTPSPMRSFM